MITLLALALAAAPADLVKERVVNAPPAEVWRLWTTADGAKRFFAPDARIEPKAGGAFELYFAPGAPAGLRGSEGCTVKIIEPQKRLTFTWSFPPSLPTLRGKVLTEVTVRLAPEGKGTRVTLTHAGWKDVPDADKGRAYFDRAWTTVLARLDRSFRRGPIDWRFGWKPASPVALEFLTGTWRGEDGGEELSETWVANPAGLAGMFHAVKDGRVKMSELADVSVDGEEVLLMLRIFGPTLADSKLTPGTPLLFVLESVDASSAVFLRPGTDELIRYEVEGDTLTGSFESKAKTTRYVLRRVKPTTDAGVPH